MHLADQIALVAVPLVATSGNTPWIFAASILGAGLSLGAATRLPDLEPGPQDPGSRFASLIDGSRHVISQPHLRAVAICSLLWNSAFTVLLVALLPWLDELGEDPGVFGVALAAFGLGAILGSWVAGKTANAIEPSTVLVLGPATSVVAVGIVLSRLVTDSSISIHAGFFLLGVGPSTAVPLTTGLRRISSYDELTTGSVETVGSAV